MKVVGFELAVGLNCSIVVPLPAVPDLSSKLQTSSCPFFNFPPPY